MATWVQPSACNQSRKRNSSAVVVPQLRICFFTPRFGITVSKHAITVA
jgi:hypothetical protein